ncbi:cAMP-dependent protein kinase type II regulatory subunit-like [Lineus longissimus]|uniref:cAMP-dependent protein kinase type II regulatory subunit-like n=1 Tax=Lineus longissimus TaxID=88925 RepID=UPI00315D704A
MNLEIPDGLGDMLRDFTVSVLREKPMDIYEYAVEYFTKVRDKKANKNVPMYIIVDDDDQAREPDPGEFRPITQKNNRFARRHSVSAERYDPEADDDTEKVVHPKTDDQRERLLEAVGGILLFRSLDPDQMQDVLDAMFEKRATPGEHVIEQGDDGDNFYVIDQGTYDVLVTVNGEQKRVHVFEDQGSFGELALMYNMPRSATVVAKTKGVLWAMTRNSFRTIVLKAAFKKRKMYESLLEGVPMLKHLDQYERMNLADALTPRIYQDCIILKEGDDADGMYFIEDGNVKITITKDGKEAEVARSGKGKYFGEMALVENKPRSANVYAVGKVKLAFLEVESFERLLGPCLDIMKRTIAKYKQK